MTSTRLKIRILYQQTSFNLNIDLILIGMERSTMWCNEILTKAVKIILPYGKESQDRKSGDRHTDNKILVKILKYILF